MAAQQSLKNDWLKVEKVFQPLALHINKLLIPHISELFFSKLPEHLQQSRLQNFIDVEIKSLLFSKRYCEELPQALQILRHQIVAIDNVQLNNSSSYAQTELNTLHRFATDLEAKLQSHWEYYRYQQSIDSGEIVNFMRQLDKLYQNWQMICDRFNTTKTILAGRSLPSADGQSTLVVTWQAKTPSNYVTQADLSAIISFLSLCQEALCKVLEKPYQSLHLLEIGVQGSLSITLNIPHDFEVAYNQLLQYLCLKDILKKEALLKFVFESIQKQFNPSCSLSKAAISQAYKPIGAILKDLPDQHKISINGVEFPEQNIEVLNNLEDDLAKHNLKAQTLFKEKPQSSSKDSVAKKQVKSMEHVAVLTARDVPLEDHQS